MSYWPSHSSRHWSYHIFTYLGDLWDDMVANGELMQHSRKYEIRRLITVTEPAVPGEVKEIWVTVQENSRSTGQGYAFATQDQSFVQEITDVIEEACEYFWKRPIPEFWGVPEIEGITESEIERRINTYNDGENQREAKRTMKKKFDLAQLPPERKRALIERVEQVKNKWGFRWLE